MKASKYASEQLGDEFSLKDFHYQVNNLNCCLFTGQWNCHWSQWFQGHWSTLIDALQWRIISGSALNYLLPANNFCLQILMSAVESWMLFHLWIIFLFRHHGNEHLKNGYRLKCQISKSFTLVIRPLSTLLIKPNFYVLLSHRRSNTVSLETRRTVLKFILTPPCVGCR